MSLTPEDRAAFVTAYTRILINAWSDATFAQRLDTDPHAALADTGIALPPGAAVEVHRPESDGGDPQDAGAGFDAQIALYEKGLADGHFVFYVPPAPRVPTEQLGNDELHGVAAGGVWDPYCCSCCPNCCSASGG